MDIAQFRDNFDKSLEYLKQDLSAVRTNRAAPAMLENIQVEVYGAKMPLIQVANIQAPEPKMLIVEPWDRNVVKDVEKAVQSASLGLNITNEGTFLRIIMSPMTEETRNELIKVLKDKLESGRQQARGVRDDIKEKIIKAEKDKEITEDDRYRLISDLDDMTREYNEKIKEIGEKKEKEIKL